MWQNSRWNLKWNAKWCTQWEGGKLKLAWWALTEYCCVEIRSLGKSKQLYEYVSLMLRGLGGSWNVRKCVETSRKRRRDCHYAGVYGLGPPACWTVRKVPLRHLEVYPFLLNNCRIHSVLGGYAHAWGLAVYYGYFKSVKMTASLKHH